METGILSNFIEKNTIVGSEEKRSYIGASSIGKYCEREIWYGFHGFEKKAPHPKVKRIFEAGSSMEILVKNLMLNAGISLELPQEENDYLAVYDADIKNFRGHMDAIMNSESVIEIKSAKDSSFNMFVKRGLRAWYTPYYAQIQAYMGMSGLKDGYVIAINKDSSELHDERVIFDPNYYESLKTRALRIMESESEPPKINISPLFFMCKACGYKDSCHFNY